MIKISTYLENSTLILCLSNIRLVSTWKLPHSIHSFPGLPITMILSLGGILSDCRIIRNNFMLIFSLLLYFNLTENTELEGKWWSSWKKTWLKNQKSKASTFTCMLSMKLARNFISPVTLRLTSDWITTTLILRSPTALSWGKRSSGKRRKRKRSDSDE